MNLELIIKYLLPIFYAGLFAWLLVRSKLILKAGFTKTFVICFLGLKIVTGIAYTYIMLHFIPAAKEDIDLFFGGGLEMFQVFRDNPKGFPAYLSKVFTVNDFSIGSTDSDLIRRAFDGIKLVHFVLNLFSGGHLYTNVLLFNCLASWLFLRCWGHLKIYLGSGWLGAWVFLFPSAFFFTSVVLKEGIELSIIAAILPLLINYSKSSRLVSMVSLIFLFVLLFFFKFLIAFTFLASMFLYMLFRRFPTSKFKIALGASLLFILCFFGLKYIIPALDLPRYIVERRLEFQELEANSALKMRELEPQLLSFVLALPEAVHNVLFRPWPGEGGKITYLVFSAEILAFWFFILFILYRNRKSGFKSPGPEAWAFLLFAIINLLIIGYTITNIGAITRYRSIFLPGIAYFIFMSAGGSKFAAESFNRFRFFKIKAK